MRLSEGEYTVVGYLFDGHGVPMYDHRQVERNLLVSQPKNYPGMVRLHHSFELQPWDGVLDQPVRSELKDLPRSPGRV